MGEQWPGMGRPLKLSSWVLGAAAVSVALVGLAFGLLFSRRWR